MRPSKAYHLSQTVDRQRRAHNNTTYPPDNPLDHGRKRKAPAAKAYAGKERYDTTKVQVLPNS